MAEARKVECEGCEAEALEISLAREDFVMEIRWCESCGKLSVDEVRQGKLSEI